MARSFESNKSRLAKLNAPPTRPVEVEEVVAAIQAAEPVAPARPRIEPPALVAPRRPVAPTAQITAADAPILAEIKERKPVPELVSPGDRPVKTKDGNR